MNYYSYLYATRGLIIVAVSLVWVFVPVYSTYATSYVWGGQTFTNEADMQEYMREYIRVRNELYGTHSTVSYGTGTTRTTTSSTVTRTNTSRSVGSKAVSTRTAEEVTFSGARLVGVLDRTPTTGTKVWFQYGTDWRNLWFATAPERRDSTFGSKTFDRKVENLKHDTTYYYRAVVERNGVVSYGSLRTFTTPADTNNRDSGLRVTTGSASGVKDNRAVLNGSFTFNKATAKGFVWIEYGDDPLDLYKKSPQQSVSKSSGTKSVTYSARGLDESTTYYFRLVGYDERGVKNYGVTRSFKTPIDIIGEKPKVTTVKVGAVTTYSAVLNGNVAMNDFNNGIAFFVYGEDRVALQNLTKEYNRYSRIKTNGDLLQKVLVDSDLDSDETFTATIANLDFNTPHYYAMGVEYEDDDGNEWIVLGSIQSFTTKKLQ